MKYRKEAAKKNGRQKSSKRIHDFEYLFSKDSELSNQPYLKLSENMNL